MSRRARSTSSSFNTAVIAICIAGIALVVGSVIGRTVLESPPYAANSKKVKAALDDLQKLQRAKNPDVKQLEAATQKYNDLNAQTHVHSAYGIWNCDKYVAPFDASQLPDTLGIHAHEDGLIHIHPFVSRAAGKKARLQLFFDATLMEMTTKKLAWVTSPDGSTKITLNVDKDKCNGKKAEIWLLYWEKADGKNITKTPTKYIDNFGDIRMTGDSAYAFVFAPKGTSIPMPPSVQTLPTPSDVAVPDATTGTETTTGSTIVVPDTAAGSATTAAGSATTVAGSATTVAGSATTTPATTAPATTAPATTTASTTATTTAGGVDTTVKK